jgi:hypothetical protein
MKYELKSKHKIYAIILDATGDSRTHARTYADAVLTVRHVKMARALQE